MEISSLSNSQSAVPAKPVAGAARGASTAPGRGASPAPASAPNVNLGAFEAVQQAMNHCPDSRAEAIARGKALAADPNYPPTEVADKLARLFLADAESESDAD